MNRVEQNPLVRGERDAQQYRVPFAATLPDVALEGLRVGRSRSGPKAAGHAGKVEPENSLLRLRLDVGAATLANGERRAVNGLAVERDVQNEGVAARAIAEPVPHDFVARRSGRLARYGDRHERYDERHSRDCAEQSPEFGALSARGLGSVWQRHPRLPAQGSRQGAEPALVASLTLQVLAEAPHEPGLDEAERAVGGGADLVVWLRVRGKLPATL